jgi:hypothetical protein
VSGTASAPPSRAATSASGYGSLTRTRVSWALTAFVALFLAFDGVTHVLRVSAVQDSMHDLGYPAGSALGIGLLELGCLALYLMPRTAPLGALLLTAYLGGAVAAQVRIQAPLLSTTLFPVYTAALLWAGLALRDRRVRALLPRPQA